jgi:hypothetical protein
VITGFQSHKMYSAIEKLKSINKFFTFKFLSALLLLAVLSISKSNADSHLDTVNPNTGIFSLTKDSIHNTHNAVIQHASPSHGAPNNEGRRILPVFQKTINKFQPFYFFMFIGGFIMLAVIRIINPPYLFNIFTASINLKLLLSLFKEGIFGFNITSMLLDILCVAMLSIGVQIFFFVNQPQYFLWILSFISIAYVLKLIAIQFFANIFMGRGEALIHLLMHLLFTRFLGLALLPLLFVILYQPLVDVNSLLKIVIIAILVFYSAWVLRLFIQMKTMSASGVIYLFLYLCTIEFSPLTILFKDYIR